MPTLEGFPGQAQEQEHNQAAVIAMLQQELGVSEDVAASFASVVVECPKPGEGRDSTLAEFITSEHGTDKKDVIIERTKAGLERGASPDEALIGALGFSAKVDETGQLVRFTPEAVPVKKKT
ncbi:MAG TPA: hypothetical protein VIH90_03905 [Candidatus Saccharimonadales bacterium]